MIQCTIHESAAASTIAYPHNAGVSRTKHPKEPSSETGKERSINVDNRLS
jgi:hypothetical protein